MFTAIAREVSEALNLPMVEMCRYEPDGTATVIGATGDHPFQPGTNWPLDGPSLTAQVRRTERPARIDDYADVSGKIGDAAREGVHPGVGAPILVDRRVWEWFQPAATPQSGYRPMPRLGSASSTELLATAIANTQARKSRTGADEQSALRRLATLVAGRSRRCVRCGLPRNRPPVRGHQRQSRAFHDRRTQRHDGRLGVHDAHLPTGTRLPLRVTASMCSSAIPQHLAVSTVTRERPVSWRLLRKRGVKSEVGAPVVVEGRVWGALIAGTDDPEPLPRLEQRLSSFAELIATAISNASNQTELIASRTRIVEAADEQRRRVVRDLHDGAQQLGGGRHDVATRPGSW